MQTIDQQTAAQRMAQWRATGGAIEAAGAEAAPGDDGLAAQGPTGPRTCYADDGLATGSPRTATIACYADDGLQAAFTATMRCYAGDDGLSAGPLPSANQVPPPGCYADDGLAALRPTGPRSCYADDGLGATMATGRIVCGNADDGLTAMMPTERFSCGYADDGLQARYWTRLSCADDGLTASGVTATVVCYADDGLTAQARSGRLGCYADDGLMAGGYTTKFCPVMTDDGLAAILPTLNYTCR